MSTSRARSTRASPAACTRRRSSKAWDQAVRASFAVGQSATHQISHTKGGVLDGVVAFEGSTNWSGSGEGAGIKLGQGAENSRPASRPRTTRSAVYTTRSRSRSSWPSSTTSTRPRCTAGRGASPSPRSHGWQSSSSTAGALDWAYRRYGTPAAARMARLSIYKGGGQNGEALTCRSSRSWESRRRNPAGSRWPSSRLRARSKSSFELRSPPRTFGRRRSRTGARSARSWLGSGL